MAQNKYGKYVINDRKTLEVNFKNRDPFFHTKDIKQWPGLDFQIAIAPISAPEIMEERPMKHDFDQVLCFIGGDTKDIFKFDADVELSLGEEQEKHIINSPTIVHIPKGLTHCPLNFKRIGKPIIFLDITLTTAYTRKEKTGDGWSGTVKHEDLAITDAKKHGGKK